MLLERKESNNQEADSVEIVILNMNGLTGERLLDLFQVLPWEASFIEVSLWGLKNCLEPFPPLPLSINAEPPVVNSTVPMMTV